jgi:hypothetical protein
MCGMVSILMRDAFHDVGAGTGVMLEREER